MKTADKPITLAEYLDALSILLGDQWETSQDGGIYAHSATVEVDVNEIHTSEYAVATIRAYVTMTTKLLRIDKPIRVRIEMVKTEIARVEEQAAPLRKELCALEEQATTREKIQKKAEIVVKLSLGEAALIDYALEEAINLPDIGEKRGGKLIDFHARLVQWDLLGKEGMEIYCSFCQRFHKFQELTYFKSDKETYRCPNAKTIRLVRFPGHNDDLEPETEAELSDPKLLRELDEAMQEVEDGETYTHEQMLEFLDEKVPRDEFLFPSGNEDSISLCERHLYTYEASEILTISETTSTFPYCAICGKFTPTPYWVKVKILEREEFDCNCGDGVRHFTGGNYHFRQARVKLLEDL